MAGPSRGVVRRQERGGELSPWGPPLRGCTWEGSIGPAPRLGGATSSHSGTLQQGNGKHGLFPAPVELQGVGISPGHSANPENHS